MRLHFVTLLIILACLQVAAKSDAQRISLTVSDQPLEKTFNQIQAQSGYKFMYQKERLKNAVLVTLKLKDATLKEALEQLFKDQPFSYQVLDKTILVKEKSNSVLESIQEYTKTILLNGTVTNERGEPLTGVNISIKGTKTVTSTDNRGSYRLQAEAGRVLVFSFVGYQNEEVPVRNLEKLDITLKPSQSELDKVQVIAYGSTTKRLSTGNTATVTSEEISNQPVSNPILALQGRVPGITIEQSSGLPGANVTVRIQGVNSIRQGNDPFYVIDGVPYNSESLPSLAGGRTLNGGSPLAFINPATIESIEVLKDADATAIYGSRAANGAILITTKKGKSGRTQVDLNAQEGLGKITRKIKLLNTQQYLEIRKEAYFTNDKLTTASTKYATQYDINGTWDQNRYTDWQKELIGGTARYQDYQAALSGGNSSTQFLFGTGYHRETTVFPGDLADRKVSVQFSINHRSGNNKFRFQLSGNYLDDVNKLSAYDLTGQALTLSPNAPALYLPDGSLNWELLPNGNSSWNNPLTYILRTYNAKTNNLLVNSVIGYQILPGLEIKSSIGYNKLRSDENSKTPLATAQPEVRALASSDVQNSTKTGTNWIIEPQVTYKRAIGYSTLDVLLGATFQNTQSNLLAIKASGFASDGQMDNIRSATSVSITDALQSEYRYTALFGRIGYNYKQKYLLNVTGRRDGTSRFGPENRFHSFYSVGGAWIFSEESFVKSFRSFLTFGKLRASYGITGSDQVGDYSYLNLYSIISPGVPYQGATGLKPDGHTNPYLQWEQTNKLNLGLDLGFLSERILFNANFFRNVCGNQLVSASLPNITGFNSIAQNLPAKVLNQGIELLLETQPLLLKNIKWTSSINITIPKNKLLEFPGLSSNNSYKNSLIVGQSIRIAKAYNYAGINPVTGLYQFLTSQGTLTSSPSSTTDLTQILEQLPKWYGGIQNSLTINSFQIDFLFQFVSQKARDYRAGDRPGIFSNQPITVLDRWQDKDHPGSVQMVTTNSTTSFSAYTSSNAGIADASFLRLKNASISWLMPKRWITKLKMQQVRAFLLGQNLITVTKFQGDPETRSTTSLPPLQVITIGLRVSL